MRKVFVILDIETITDARLAFDIAWLVCDSKGNVLDRYNALVSEIVDAPFGSALIRRDSFMKNKANFYLDNNFFVKPFYEIAGDFASIADTYNAKIVMCAYNGKFDYSVLNDNANLYYGMDFFEDRVEIVDIMTLAMATICDSNKYVRWCLLNGMTTDKGNIKTNAETVYAYMLQDANYTEAHHALEDCEIEHDIYFRARRYHKGGHTHFCNPIFRSKEWRKIQNRK